MHPAPPRIGVLDGGRGGSASVRVVLHATAKFPVMRTFLIALVVWVAFATQATSQEYRGIVRPIAEPYPYKLVAGSGASCETVIGAQRISFRVFVEEGAGALIYRALYSLNGVSLHYSARLAENGSLVSSSVTGQGTEKQRAILARAEDGGAQFVLTGLTLDRGYLSIPVARERKIAEAFLASFDPGATISSWRSELRVIGETDFLQRPAIVITFRREADSFVRGQSLDVEAHGYVLVDRGTGIVVSGVSEEIIYVGVEKTIQKSELYCNSVTSRPVTVANVETPTNAREAAPGALRETPADAPQSKPDSATQEEVVPSKETILAAQTLLNALGYDVGASDGVIGNRTRSAIERFQLAAGLPVDGTVTDALVARLSQSLAVARATPQQRGMERSATGTGFFVSRSGQAVTNQHVIEGCTEVTVRRQGDEERLVRIEGFDVTNDLALLASGTTPQSISKFRQGRGIRAGDTIIATGFPLYGLLTSDATVTTGTVSALSGLRNDIRFFQVTVPVQQGNSGGPLLDVSGNVVGLVVGKLNALKIAEITGDIPQNVNFAIKASVVRNFLDTNSVDYLTAPSENRMTSADVGEEAKGYTLLVECWKRK